MAASGGLTIGLVGRGLAVENVDDFAVLQLVGHAQSLVFVLGPAGRPETDYEQKTNERCEHSVSTPVEPGGIRRQSHRFLRGNHAIGAPPGGDAAR